MNKLVDAKKMLRLSDVDRRVLLEYSKLLREKDTRVTAEAANIKSIHK